MHQKFVDCWVATVAIPKMLRKKLRTSTHPLKYDIFLCIHDLLNEGDEEEDETQDWVHIVNRRGLTLVNNVTFDVFWQLKVRECRAS